MEGGAALATAWGRKLRDWAGADLTDPSRTYVVKPAAVGLASVPGEFVFIVTGLPQAAVSAFSLIALVSLTSRYLLNIMRLQWTHLVFMLMFARMLPNVYFAASPLQSL